MVGVPQRGGFSFSRAGGGARSYGPGAVLLPLNALGSVGQCSEEVQVEAARSGGDGRVCHSL